MAVRRIINDVLGLSVSQDPKSIRNDQPVRTAAGAPGAGGPAAFFDQGEVQAVAGVFITVKFNGQTSRATMATDEPLRAGHVVWILTAQGGELVVLGRVKT